MSEKQKQIERLLSKPKDFTFDELTSLLKGFGYVKDNKGKTSGLRVAYVHPITKSFIRLDKPHPDNTLKAYSGQFNVRVDSALHKSLSLYASKEGITLNQCVSRALAEFCAEPPREYKT